MFIVMEITLEHTYRCHATTEMNIQTVYKYVAYSTNTGMDCSH